MDPAPNYFSDEVRRQLGDTRQSRYQAFAGTDIQACMYLPLLTQGSANNQDRVKFRVFAELQTISISSTRSVSPVRTLGRSSAMDYTRGARTFAGTMVFATVNRDAFADVYDVAIAESLKNASTSLVADQLPPFSIVITAANEYGGAAIQVVHGITILNYGTTYSIEDLMTETQYTYVATDVTPLLDRKQNPVSQGEVFFKSVSSLVEDSMVKVYSNMGRWNIGQKSMSDYIEPEDPGYGAIAPSTVAGLKPRVGRF